MTAVGGDVDPVTVERAPTLVSTTLAVAAAVGAAVLASTAASPALPVGLAAAGLVGVGITAGSRTGLAVGAAGTFGTAVIAAVAGGTVPVVVGATLAAVLAWDFGDQALDVGTQVGRGPSTWRGEAGHALASVGVGVAMAVAVVTVYRVATGGLSTTALVALAAAAILLTGALRH